MFAAYIDIKYRTRLSSGAVKSPPQPRVLINIDAGSLYHGVLPSVAVMHLNDVGFL